VRSLSSLPEADLGSNDHQHRARRHNTCVTAWPFPPEAAHAISGARRVAAAQVSHGHQERHRRLDATTARSEDRGACVGDRDDEHRLRSADLRRAHRIVPPGSLGGRHVGLQLIQRVDGCAPTEASAAETTPGTSRRNVEAVSGVILPPREHIKGEGTPPGMGWLVRDRRRSTCCDRGYPLRLPPTTFGAAEDSRFAILAYACDTP